DRLLGVLAVVRQEDADVVARRAAEVHGELEVERDRAAAVARWRRADRLHVGQLHVVGGAAEILAAIRLDESVAGALGGAVSARGRGGQARSERARGK